MTSLLREKHAWSICFDCGVLWRLYKNNNQGPVLSTLGEQKEGRDNVRPDMNPKGQMRRSKQLSCVAAGEI